MSNLTAVGSLGPVLSGGAGNNIIYPVDPVPTLQEIRATLIGLEDQIIQGLINRANYNHNKNIYPSERNFDYSFGHNRSFLLKFIHSNEIIAARNGTFLNPNEHPFTKPLPSPRIDVTKGQWPKVVVKNAINFNRQILKNYVLNMVGNATASTLDRCIECKEDSTDNDVYTKSAALDLSVLQLISRRIHYGKIVAESKFQNPKESELYIKYIKAKNDVEITKLLTDTKVEQAVLDRVKNKTEQYGKDKATFAKDMVRNSYRDIIIPLTKDVEVAYLLRRLDQPAKPNHLCKAKY